jgi:two-component system phosphate regulon response regulator PhoB
MSKKRILIIEDERDLADLVALRLRREGYEVDVALNGAEGLARIRSEPPDLAIVDIMLPEMSGTDLVQELRQDPRTEPVPVIFLTARSEESDVVAGLRLGADDYVTKPFSMSVLVARVAALIRRARDVQHAAGATVQAGPIVIDPERHQVLVGGRPVSLTLTEFRLLAALVTSQGRVLTRNQLIDLVLGANAVVTDRTIDVHLTALRRKLGPARTLIRTVRGVGYCFAPEGVDGDTAT